MRILIIEDNALIAEAIKRNLQDFYIIDLAANGEDGMRSARSVSYDAILLDLNLPDIDGEDVCRELRDANISSPIIILSGRGEVKSKISLLNMGADDYVTKPFNMYELKARVDVAIRHKSTARPNGKLKIVDLELDPIARRVERGGQVIDLRKKEFDLLEYMMRNQGQTLTRAMILEHIWDMTENLWANVVDVHIKHLRDKVDRPYPTKLIKTVHGIGYKLEPVKARSI